MDGWILLDLDPLAAARAGLPEQVAIPDGADAAAADATWLADRPATNPVISWSAGAPHDGHCLSPSRRNPWRNTSNSSAHEVQRRS